MKNSSANRITWLIKNVDQKLDVVGFIRDHKDSFFIIGSKTGSYYGGHGESWKDKWEELLKEGFVLSNEALNQKLIPTWRVS